MYAEIFLEMKIFERSWYHACSEIWFTVISKYCNVIFLGEFLSEILFLLDQRPNKPVIRVLVESKLFHYAWLSTDKYVNTYLYL